ncbi:hypothetical protein BASA81_012844 [Batrachochytrium salamandrivorans]|nr:hypothetical protein BASA81_012844 [Batrachochytrium salamandrivorans]
MASLRNTKFDNIGDEEDEEERQLVQLDLDRVKCEAELAKKKQQDDEDSDSDSDSGVSPLFWTKPPSMRKNATKEQLEMEKTFNSMIYDDKPPKQLAVEAKDRGNIALQQGFCDVARDAYKEGLKFAHQAWNDEFDATELIATLLNNRAQVELKAKNYRAAIKDCKASLKLVPTSNKAKFRGAKACLAINKPNEALECFLFDVEELVDDGLVMATTTTKPSDVDKTMEELRTLSKIKRECMQLEQKLRIQAATVANRITAQASLELKWRELFIQHKVKIGPLTMDLQHYTGGVETVGNPGPKPTIKPNGAWAWPVLFMYPEHSQSDFVQEFDESTLFKDMLGTMFATAPDWDVNHRYGQVTDLQVYVRERQVKEYDLTKRLEDQLGLHLEEIYSNLRWFKVALNLTLGEVLRHSKLVVPGLPTFIVLSRKSLAYNKTFLDSIAQQEGREAVRNL